MAVSPENLSKLNARHRATLIVVGVQCTVVAALCIVFLLQPVRFENAVDDQTITTLWTAVLFLTIGSFLLRRLFNSWERLTNAALLGGVDGLLKKLQSNAVITCGFGVVAGIVGFVISQMTGEFADLLRAAAVSSIVFFANFPRKRSWMTVIERAEQL